MTDDCSLPEDPNKDLLKLKSDMETESQHGTDLFFFPTCKGVKGYWGTGPVWFVGQKPSKESSFPTNADELLYDTLAVFGFQNAHITDLSKERGPVTEYGIPLEEVPRMLPYFQREVEMLQPELLVAMGRYAENALKDLSFTDGIEIRYVHHYSWAAGVGDRAVLESEVSELSEDLGIKK